MYICSTMSKLLIQILLVCVHCLVSCVHIDTWTVDLRCTILFYILCSQGWVADGQLDLTADGWKQVEESFYIGSKISQPIRAELAHSNTWAARSAHTLSVHPFISICLTLTFPVTYKPFSQPFSPLIWPCHRQFQLVWVLTLEGTG